ncbi:MAG TPA: hypothetical protein VGM90_32510 [Kofleriaceae bacterium]
MRSFVLIAVALSSGLTGCELQPAPQKQPEAQRVAPAPAPVPDAGSVPVALAPANPLIPPDVVPVDAPTKPDVSADCNNVGIHVAQMVIDNAPDPAQKAQMEGERERIIRKTSEACTQDRWPKVSIECFIAAKSMPELQECGKNLAAPKED